MVKFDIEKRAFCSKFKEHKVEEVPLSLVYTWVKAGELSKSDFIVFIELYKNL